MTIQSELPDSLYATYKSKADQLYSNWLANNLEPKTPKKDNQMEETSLQLNQYLIPVGVIIIVVLLFIYFMNFTSKNFVFLLNKIWQ